MPLQGKEIMTHLAAVAKQQLACSIYIAPEAAEYSSTITGWERMGNSGQVHLAPFDPEEGNLRLIPGESRLRVVYRSGDCMYRFESLLMRAGGRDADGNVIRMPQQIDQLQGRRVAHRVGATENNPIILEFTSELQKQVPVTRVPSENGEFYVTLSDPMIVDLSKKGMAFNTNFRLDRMKRGELLESIRVRLPEGEPFDLVLRIEYVKHLEASHYRFRCGASIPFLPTMAERWVDRFIQKRLRDDNVTLT